MEVERYLSGYFDEALLPEQIAEFSAWLKQEPENVRLFVVRAAMESHLKDLMDERSMRAAPDIWPPEEPEEESIEVLPALTPDEVENDSADAASAASDPGIDSPQGAPAPALGHRRVIWASAAAAAIVLLLGGAIWHGLAGRPDAMISDAIDVAWADGSPAKVGTALSHSSYDLSTGVVELKLRNNVSVVVQGPARFTLFSPERILLQSGRLSALVPASAHGFTVAVHGAEFVDLGTEFAIETHPDSFTHAEVFVGTIQARLMGPSHQLLASQTISSSHAVEVTEAGIIVNVKAHPLAYAWPGQISSYRPVQLASQQPAPAFSSSEPAAPSTSPDIHFVGTVADTDAVAEVTHWLTPSVKKSKDVTGRNVYGASLGCVDWTHGSTGEQSQGSSTLGWAYLGSGQDYSKSDYSSIDDVHNSVNSVNLGITSDHFQFQLTGTPADYAGKRVRVGIMQDCLGSDEESSDTFKGLRIIRTSGAGRDEGAVQAVRSGAAGSGTLEFYLFDLTDVKPGDTFDIQAVVNVGGTSGATPYLGPVFWDIAPAGASGK